VHCLESAQLDRRGWCVALKALNWIGENRFTVWVKPRAGRNQVVGVREGALHLALTAPPVQGEANKALVRFLADLLDLRQNQVEIVSGQHSRHKVVRIVDISSAELHRRVESIIR
jgi:uncharacterized protein (TIGR00251 family)